MAIPPNAGCSCLLRINVEVTRLSVDRPLHAISYIGVPAIENCGEQVQ